MKAAMRTGSVYMAWSIIGICLSFVSRMVSIADWTPLSYDARIASFVSRLVVGAVLPALLSLPSELLRIILLDVVGDAFLRPKLFIESRSATMRSCTVIYIFVATCGDFWSSYVVRPMKTLSEMDRWSSNFHRSLLNLRVFFDNYHEDHDSAPGTASFAHVVSFLVKHMHRCHDLQLTGDNRFSLPAVLDSLRGADFTSLRSLSILRYGPRIPFDPVPRVTNQSPFEDQVPGLRVLRLFDIVFHWDRMVCFTGLTTLVLHELRSVLSPKATDLWAVIASNPRLIRLSIRSVLCGSVSSDLQPLFLCDLRELDLSPRGCKGLGELMALIRCPRIETLSFVFAARNDVDILLGMTSVMLHITTFCASGHNHNAPRLCELFPAMPAVVCMDISDINRSLFDAMLTADNMLSSPVCPRLTELTLSECAIGDLRRFVKGRVGKADPLKDLVAHYIYDLDHVAKYSWDADTDVIAIQEHVGNFVIDPPFVFHVSWING
ncbi:hypothetical protein C8R44DRAFT_740127 [Mycena epipterygia]|nr:hypothetical protein C8R44DRAFT_740127 [Mycena epipterygia]